jgi:hypothetical protein
MRTCPRKNNREQSTAREMADGIKWRCLLVTKKMLEKGETPGQEIETED